MIQRIVTYRLNLLWSNINISIGKKLIAGHKFYNINHRHRACRLEGNSDSDDDELVGSEPITIHEAAGRYPERAVMALFNVLGFEYSRAFLYFEVALESFYNWPLDILGFTNAVKASSSTETSPPSRP
jgi:hypothetical protein